MKLSDGEQSRQSLISPTRDHSGVTEGKHPARFRVSAVREKHASADVRLVIRSDAEEETSGKFTINGEN